MQNENPTSIKGLFQGLVPDPVAPLQGKVVSVSPLKIQAENDEKLTLNAPLLIVPRHLTDYTAKVDVMLDKGTIKSETTVSGSHNHDGGEHQENNFGDNGQKYAGGKHKHPLETFAIYGGTLKVYNALKVGEQVHLLSMNNGKKYYVLDRVV